MEHIDGKFMVSYCKMDRADTLHPKVFATLRVGATDLKVDEKLRLTPLRDLIHGLAAQFKACLEPYYLQRESVLISKSATSGALRATFIDYCGSCLA